jgi:hypothetical protein
MSDPGLGIPSTGLLRASSVPHLSACHPPTALLQGFQLTALGALHPGTISIELYARLDLESPE